MECADEKSCETKVSCILQEIDNSFAYILNQKSNAVNTVKLYLVELAGLLGYAAFVQTNILKTAAIVEDKSSYLMFSIFGMVLAFLVFLSGWVMLSYLSHILSSITKSHKHICGMRFLKAQLFPDGSFKDKSVMPISYKDVPIFYSTHLPVIFSIINFSALIMVYYFLHFSQSTYLSFWITGGLISIFAIYYPSACVKFYKHMICAERSCPEKTEIKTENIGTLPMFLDKGENLSILITMPRIARLCAEDYLHHIA